MLRLRLFALLSITLLAVVTHVAPSQSPEPSGRTRAFQVLDLLESFTVPTPPPIGRVLHLHEESSGLLPILSELDEAGGDEAPPTLFSVADRGPLRDADQLVDHVRNMIGKDTCEREVQWMLVQNGILYVAAPTAILDQVDRIVRNLRPAFAPRFQLDYVLFRPDDEDSRSGTSRLTVESADKLLAQLESGTAGTILYRARAQQRVGDGFRFGEETIDGFQPDVDAEIAQAAAIAEPRMLLLQLGHTLMGQSMLATDGQRIGLFLIFTRRGFARPPEPLDLVVNGIRVERARVRTVQSGFSILMPGDGAALFHPGGWFEPNLAFLLVARRLDRAPGSVASREVLPVGFVTSRAFTGLPDGLSGVSTMPIDREFILEHALSIGCNGGDENGLRISHHPDVVTVSGDPMAVSRTARFVRSAASRAERCYQVEIIREVKLPGEPGSDWRPAGRTAIPIVARRLSFAILGAEETDVVGHDVEVAQKSKTYDPVVRSVFDGTQVVVAVEPAGDFCRVTVALLSQVADPSRLVLPASPDTGPAWIRRIRHAIFRRTMLMTLGTTHLLGDIPTAAGEKGVPRRERLRLRILKL